MNSPTVENIRLLLSKTKSYLEHNQQSQGNFLSLSSADPTGFIKPYIFSTVFSPALILSSLNRVKSLNIDDIKKKLVGFLLKQRDENWRFNYWDRKSKEFIQIPYPDDLDDICCAMSSLYEYDKKIINGKALSSLVEILTLLEVKEGGPYTTWLVSKEANLHWRDVDLAVNCNIAYLLHLLDIQLPSLNRYIEESIKTNNINSLYYPTEIIIIYFLSRFYSGNHKKKIVKLLKKKIKNFKKLSILEIILINLCLLNFREDELLIDACINYLLKNEVNLFKPYPFYIGVNPKKDSIYYAGSSFLTIALGMELLDRYLVMQRERVEINKTLVEVDKKAESLNKQILIEVNNNFSVVPKQTYNIFKSSLDRVVKIGLEKEITLLPYFFSKSINQDIPDSLVIKLGMGSLYGWIAYTIYDDLLDEDSNLITLPVANICLRELTIIFSKIADNHFERFFKRVIDRIENINCWEILNCRVKLLNNSVDLKSLKVPRYKLIYLADKSIGHCLSVVAVLYSLGFKEKSKEVRGLLKFFEYYLIARQLNDDAHDWEKDLEKGQINYVTAQLLQKIKIKRIQTNHNLTEVSISLMIKEMQTIFWYQELVNICSLIFKYTKLARQELKEIKIIKDTAIFDKLLGKYEQAATLALEERVKMMEFLDSYKG